ncbi:MAG: Asp-tRNA(Asn)/Glu-tRNA(Gln) amidotransferase subunit GatC [Acidithiobacillus sp.]|uniref:Asp-tRNA(Asn)/Glu-tRNA(Gln) amidotransferase subunit GatC n=1 Tax=Acidithiobacillus sp. TaxID=1872118 RepID=UPI003D0740B7
MSFTTDTVKRTASLARLALPEADLANVAQQLEGILVLIEKLSAVPTEGVEIMAHPLELQQPLREDRADERDLAGRDIYLKNAPVSADGLFLVPKVIE